MNAPYLTTWQRLLRGEYGRGVSPLSQTEAAQFYWCTDIQTPEIAAAFPDYEIGVAVMANANCIMCEAEIHVGSRTEAEKRVKDWAVAERRTDHYRRRSLMCKACYRLDTNDGMSGSRAEMQAREKRSIDLRFMPYSEYLQTPEWQSTRHGALKRAGFRCQTCAAGGSLHVHHRTYIRRGEERNADLIVLCADCHSLFHTNTKLAENGRATA